MSDNLEIKSPGALKVELSSTIHSKEAKDLFYGRKKDKDNNQNEIIGVNGFANRMKVIFSAARNDDPYADYFLIKVEQTLKNTQKNLNDILKKLNAKKPKNIKLNFQSVAPITINTAYSTTFANMAVQLLLRADEVFLLVHALRHVAAITRTEEQTLLNGNSNQKGIKTIIRSCFLSQLGYAFTNVNRKDIDLMTNSAMTAYTKMESALKQNGDDKLPDCILDRTCRSEHAPNIRVTVDFNKIMFKQKEPVEATKTKNTEPTKPKTKAASKK